MVANGIANGTVRPLSRVLYTPSEVSRAFKLVSSGRNKGRALIKMNSTETLKVIPRWVAFNRITLLCSPYSFEL